MAVHTKHDQHQMSVGTRGAYAAAGAVAATVWAAQQPLDKRAFRYAYDDVAYLGTLVTRSAPGWQVAGLAMHAMNGATFGLVYSELRRRTPGIDARSSALGLAMTEHVGLFPLAGVLDRYHPAVRSGAHPPVFGSWRAFAQATWRHALFGILLGLGARAIDRRSQGNNQRRK